VQRDGPAGSGGLGLHTIEDKVVIAAEIPELSPARSLLFAGAA
jgi:hypothetical protein